MAVAKTFRELQIWVEGIELVKVAYRLSDLFPKAELYCLTAQVRRSAVSVPANIAEGFRRKGSREFKHYLNMSHGSLAELETHFVIASELGYLSSKVEEGELFEQIDRLSRMITSFIQKLEMRLDHPAPSTRHSAQLQGEV